MKGTSAWSGVPFLTGKHMISKDNCFVADNICPVCGKILQNDSKLECGNNFLKCTGCGLVINKFYKEDNYSDKYFTEDYCKQYGKTYEEDFSSIYTESLRRLKNINNLRNSVYKSKDKFSLIDIGCAMGFFLKAAADNGADKLMGIEISEYAASFVRKNYGYDVYNRSFDEYNEDKRFDVVSFWYFLEHNPDPILTFKKLANMANNLGVIAFSVPSVFGPLYCKNRSDWYRLHPKDHSLDFTPRSLKIMLKQQGFKKIVIVPASFHPERYFTRFNGKNIFFRLFALCYRLIARKIGFGDTLEVYATR